MHVFAGVIISRSVIKNRLPLVFKNSVETHGEKNAYYFFVFFNVHFSIELMY